MPTALSRRARFTACLLAGGIAGAGTPLAVRAAADVIVSQKDQRFTPDSVALGKDQALTVVNDDGTTVHHAYVEADNFNFDSGDQKPGQRVSITFPAAGRYTVLCGIHPKMKLVVTVH